MLRLHVISKRSSLPTSPPLPPPIPWQEGDLATHAISRERRITGSRKSGVVGGVDRLLPPHRDAVGAVNRGDGDNPATTDNDALVAALGFESSQVRVDSDPSQPSDPDVCPLPTPKPLSGALRAVPEAASAAEESSSYGSRSNPVSRSERESAAAAAALTAEKARESLPAWARLGTPPPAGGVIHWRSNGGGGGVGSGGGNGLASATGGASRRDAVVRGEMMVLGKGGEGGLICGPQMKPRRESRGEPHECSFSRGGRGCAFSASARLTPSPRLPPEIFF